MRKISTSLLLLLLLLPLAACDNPASSGRHPEIAGVYDVRAPITQVSAEYRGTFTITDDDRATPGFTGSYELSVVSTQGEVINTYRGQIISGTVSRAGAVSLDLQSPDWRWTGDLDGGVITGTHTLIGVGGGVFSSGPFTATRR